MLHTGKFHTEPLKKSIPFSQCLRNCKTDEDFQLEVDALTRRLLARGYTKSSLKNAFEIPKDKILFLRIKRKVRRATLLELYYGIRMNMTK